MFYLLFIIHNSKFRIFTHFALRLDTCVLCLVSAFFCLSCSRSSRDCIVITSKIQYDVSIINKAPDMDSWIQNIEGPEREAFLQKIFKTVADGKLKTFDYDTDSPLSTDKALTILNGNFEFQNLKFKIPKLRFLEKWIINKTTSEIYKKVIAVCPLLSKDSSYIPLFWIKFDTTGNIQQAVSDVQESSLISKRIRYDVFINGSWKLETGNWKLNNDWWVDNIEPTERANLMDIILHTALSGKCRLYDYFETPITSEQLKKNFYHTDTITVPNPTNSENNKDTTMIVHKTFDKNSITKIRFMEQWYFDDKNYTFTKKVAWISPMEPVFASTNGEFRGYREIFSIYFDKKYPIKTDKN